MVSIANSPRPSVLSGERHEEWLLDDSIDDTFPARDPVSHGQPGSLVNVRYTALQRRGRRQARRASTPTRSWWLLGSLVACVLLLARRGHRR